MKGTININYEILKYLSKGYTQKEVSEELKRLGISPSSLSSVEKKCKSMLIEFNCKTLFQLMHKVGSMGIVGEYIGD